MENVKKCSVIFCIYTLLTFFFWITYRKEDLFVNKSSLQFYTKEDRRNNSFLQLSPEIIKSEVSENLTDLYEINGNLTMATTEYTGNSSLQLNQHKVGKLKTILFWTKFWGRKGFEISHEDFIKWDCEISSCQMTTNRSFLSSSAAVVFHVIDAEKSDLPATRNIFQPWIMFIVETSANRANPIHWNNFFNWTMTYRSDSDIFAPSGRFKEREFNHSNMRFNYAKNKVERAVWFVSNCVTHSRREIYVKNLQRFYPVDIIGGCGKLKCPRSESNDCLAAAAVKYKYYLSFENSLCKDYATEKVYDPLSYNILPIVFGGADYSHFVPAHSVINALDFESPKDLADFLKILDKYDSLYNSYFLWKSNFVVDNTVHSRFCNLCKKIHEPKILPKIYKDMKQWWIEEGNCTLGKDLMTKMKIYN